MLINDIETFDDAKRIMEQAFIDYNTGKLQSSFDYHLSREFRREFLNDPIFRKKFKKKGVEVTQMRNEEKCSIFCWSGSRFTLNIT